ncbi:hypothetical protein FA13DRAFT_1818064 [Coprinellus micaceus]|uniref:Uncharacterized protein n=1 Tax=Coprinellus micaceus TaxID=71717 RepID=A0A4Y7SQR7_COPMI|nr:hypothetical protein FA13DRAFT_1818064 [Coprinellus micaceus]
MAKEKKKKNRYDVPCGCRQCGSVKQVPQHIQQQHLKRDRQEAQEEMAALLQAHHAAQQTAAAIPTSGETVRAIFENLIPSDQASLADYIPLDTHQGQGTIRDLELQAAAIRQDHVINANNAHPLVPSDTGIGVHAMAIEALEPMPTQLEYEPEQQDPICDDDWEDSPEVFSTIPTTAPVSPSLPPPPPPSTTPAIAPQPIRPVASFVPILKEQENSPDPFLTTTATTPPLPPPTPDEVHLQSGIYLLYMLASWLHLQFHLPFRACNVLVTVVLTIIRSFAIAISEPAPLVTLLHIMARLDVEPAFDILPLCPQCLEVYPRSPDTPSACRKCSSPMFKPTKSGSLPSPDQLHTPLLQAPFMSIQSQLANILAIPGVEEEMDKWRRKPWYAHRYCDIFDGAVTKSLQAPDGTTF